MDKFNGSISIYIDKKNNKSTSMTIPQRKPSIWIPNEKISKCFNCKQNLLPGIESIIVALVVEFFVTNV